MTAPAPRERHRRPVARRRAVDALLILAALAALLASTRGGDGGGRRGFKVDQDLGGRPAANVPLPAPEHPVPADLQADPGSDPPQAMVGSPWYFTGGFHTVDRWIEASDTVWRPVALYPFLDFRGDGLSVIDGDRTTWTPPACACPTVHLWMYGGSTTFGLNQRDNHTIASELARAAWADGVRLVVQNRGELGVFQWVEAQRFAYDLTVDPAPDIVLFYDGVNDVWAGNIISNRHSGDTRLIMNPQHDDQWNETGVPELTPPEAPEGAKLIGWNRGVNYNLPDLAAATIARYDRARDMSRATAELHGIEPIYVWQPSRLSRDLVPGEAHDNAAVETWARTRATLLRRDLADDVIDLSDVFVHSKKPFFTDDVHHNEAAAQMIATAMYTQIEGRVRAAARSGGGS